MNPDEQQLELNAVYRTPFEPSGLFRVLEIEPQGDVCEPTAFGVFVGDHPHGYKDGSPGRYFVRELVGRKVQNEPMTLTAESLQARIRQLEIEALKIDLADYKALYGDLLIGMAAIINQLGGEFHLLDKHLHALRPNSFEIESRQDTENRCTALRVVMKK